MDDNTIKVCIDQRLPQDQQVHAAELALAENPANAPIVHLDLGRGVLPPRPEEIASIVRKQWQNGRTLRVRFLDGDPAVHEKVEHYAHQWSNHANIKFLFGTDPDAEIRISFQRDGSWSYLGTDALSIPKHQPTMNYGWLTPTSPDDEYSRVVIHEFGHALSLIHEHQHPEAAIPWNTEVVYRYYMGPPNNWTKEQVDHNLFARYSREITQFSQYDRLSIMGYAIPKEFTDGVFEVPWNRQLSETDMRYIGVIDPREDHGVTNLELDAAPTEARIGEHGEEDAYQFVIPTPGHYMTETNGSTDVVMGLFGPDDATMLLAEDDDSGRGYNARIAALLQPGTYVLRVRHYKPTGTGVYRISIKSQRAA